MGPRKALDRRKLLSMVEGRKVYTRSEWGQLLAEARASLERVVGTSPGWAETLPILEGIEAAPAQDFMTGTQAGFSAARREILGDDE